MKYILPVVLFLFASFVLSAQKNVEVAVVGFYNFENLFDTLDTKNVRDTEFTPTGSKLYNSAIYQEKLGNLAEVVQGIGTEVTPDGLAVLGVSEIENRDVLEDFVRHPKLKGRNYRVVHFDSPDRRGIDVGLIYNPMYFLPEETRLLPVILPKKNLTDTTFSRDILWVKGDFQGEEMHFFVNHWPSRSGGEKASEHKRVYAAVQAKKAIDEIRAANPNAKYILMGDLNDDPTNPSVKDVLRGKRKTKEVTDGDMFNPMWQLYKQGTGSLAWRDSWNLFDQILVSPAFVHGEAGYRFHKAFVYNRPFLVQKTGQYRGYPFRTYVGDTYRGGYSDHFPVYAILVRK